MWTARLLKGFLEAMNKEDNFGVLHIVLSFTQAFTGAGAGTDRDSSVMVLPQSSGSSLTVSQHLLTILDISPTVSLQFCIVAHFDGSCSRSPYRTSVHLAIVNISLADSNS